MTRCISLAIVTVLVVLPTWSFAKAGAGYRGGRGSSSSGGISSTSVGSRGSRTIEQGNSKPVERSAAPSGSAAGTPHTAAPSAPQASAPSPGVQPSFLQRNPILSGLAAGIAGSWIGHMLFGATNAPAAMHEGTGDPSRQEDGNASGTSGPSAALLLALMAVAAAGLYYFYKRRNDRLSLALPAAGGARSGARSEPPAWVPTSLGILSPSSSEPKLTAADEEEFRHRLIDIQTAWGRQDMQTLRRIATPEISQHFSDTLADNLSQGIENRVEDVVIMRAEVREAWAEDMRIYATVLFQWKARDYARSLSSPSGDSESPQGRAERAVVENAEAWTFVKHRDGKWLLSAIKQVE